MMNTSNIKMVTSSTGHNVMSVSCHTFLIMYIAFTHTTLDAYQLTYSWLQYYWNGNIAKCAWCINLLQNKKSAAAPVTRPCFVSLAPKKSFRVPLFSGRQLLKKKKKVRPALSIVSPVFSCRRWAPNCRRNSSDHWERWVNFARSLWPNYLQLNVVTYYDCRPTLRLLFAANRM